MVNWVLRGAVLLWAVFFTILGAQGLLDPATYTETFGIAVDGAAANTVRADLSAFFLVAAGSAAIGALRTNQTEAVVLTESLGVNVGQLGGLADGEDGQFDVEADVIGSVEIGPAHHERGCAHRV